MFSLNRVYANAILTDGKDYTFWGKGVSQGHSDAIRRIDGVLDARQYTVPVEEAVAKVRSGSQPALTTREKHLRECFVVAAEGADKEKIENEIKTMPNYFADYDTIVHFISQEELDRDHSGIPHGGFVIRSGKTGWEGENNHIIEYSLKLDSNPEFTASVITARVIYFLTFMPPNLHGKDMLSFMIFFNLSSDSLIAFILLLFIYIIYIRRIVIYFQKSANFHITNSFYIINPVPKSSHTHLISFYILTLHKYDLLR